MYSAILSKFLAAIAGPSDLAGFIDAPVNGPATNEHTVIIPPIENPIIEFDNFLLDATLTIVSIKSILISTSNINPCDLDSLLIVMPNVWLFPKKKLCEYDANKDPSICDGI